MIRWIVGLSAAAALAAPAPAQRTLSEQRLVLVYAFMAEATLAAERTAGSAAISKYRREAEQQQAKSAKLSADLAREKGLRNASASRIATLEGELRASNERIAAIAEASTAQLRQQDETYRRRFSELIATAEDLLDTPAGRRAVELAASGSTAGRSEAADLVLNELASQDEAAQAVLRAREATRYRTAAVFLLNIRGSGRATTPEIIRVSERVVENDPTSHTDWTRLVGLYRDVNDLDRAVVAGQKAVAMAPAGVERAVALLEQADTLLLRAAYDPAMLDQLQSSGVNLFQIMGTIMAQAPANDDVRGWVALFRKIAGSMQPVLRSIRTPSGVEEAYRSVSEALAQLGEERPDNSTAHSWIRARAIWRRTDLILLLDRNRIIAESDPFLSTIIKVVDTAPSPEIALVQLYKELNGKTFPPPDPRIREGYNEAIRQYRGLLAGNSSRERRLEMAALLRRYAEFMSSPETTAIGLESASEGLRISRDLSLEQPDSALVAENLALALWTMSGRSDPKSPATAALLKEARGIFDRLCAQDPASATLERGRLAVLKRMAVLKLDGTDHRMLLQHYAGLRARGLLAPSDELEVRTATVMAELGQ